MIDSSVDGTSANEKSKAEPSDDAQKPHAATIPEADQEQPLYTGTWTKEELDYSDALAEEFRSGNLPRVEDKTTLRGYLAMKLNCPVKRISKKYESSGYNGRLQYRKGFVAMTPEESQRRLQNLEVLMDKFKESREALQWAKGSTSTPSARVREDRGGRSKKSKNNAAMSPTTHSSGLHQLSRGNISGASSINLQLASRMPPTRSGGLDYLANPFMGGPFGANMGFGAVALDNLARASVQDTYNNQLLSSSLPGMAERRLMQARAGLLPGNQLGNQLQYPSGLASLRNPLTLGFQPSIDQSATLQQMREMEGIQRGDLLRRQQLGLSSHSGSSLPPARSGMLPHLLQRNHEALLQGFPTWPSTATLGTTAGFATVTGVGRTLTSDSLEQEILKRRLEDAQKEHQASKRPKGGN